MAKNHTVRITITGSEGNYSTSDSPVSDPPVKPGDRIDWFFDAPDTFPAGSVLYLRFFIVKGGQKVDHRGCMNGSQWRQGRGTTEPDGRSITGRVGLLADGTFPYEIGYREMLGGDQLLLDPEIVVEGNKRHKLKKKAAKKAKKAVKKSATAGRMKSAKTSAKKTAGKKAGKKAKKAKRSMKRKTRKR